MEYVETCLSSQTADFFDTDVQNLIPRYKYLNSGGDYIENQLKYICIFKNNKIFFSLLVLLTAHWILLS
jgi:hypothetical protein